LLRGEQSKFTHVASFGSAAATDATRRPRGCRPPWRDQCVRERRCGASERGDAARPATASPPQPPPAGRERGCRAAQGRRPLPDRTDRV